MRTLALSSGYIPYDYRRRCLSDAEAENYNAIRCTFRRLLNGQDTGIETNFYIDRTHFLICLENWNDLGDLMSKHPNPVDGKIYHWQYEEVLKGQ